MKLIYSFVCNPQIPLDKSNATFDSTLNSTLDTTELDTNSTKIDETIVEEDNGDADVESDTKEDVPEIVEEKEPVPEAVEVRMDLQFTCTSIASDRIGIYHLDFVGKPRNNHNRRGHQ